MFYILIAFIFISIISSLMNEYSDQEKKLHQDARENQKLQQQIKRGQRRN